MSHLHNLFCPTYLGSVNKTTRFYSWKNTLLQLVMEFKTIRERYTVRVFLHFHIPNKGLSFKSGHRLIAQAWILKSEEDYWLLLFIISLFKNIIKITSEYT